MDSSISRAWTPHAIFLSDRNDPLWECWYNLSNLTNQRVYQELVYRNGSFKEVITGSAARDLPSFLPFYFLVCTFSIQRTRLSRSLEQAKQDVVSKLIFENDAIRNRISDYFDKRSISQPKPNKQTSHE